MPCNAGDIAAGDIVACIRICRSGYCDAATDVVPSLQPGHMQKQSPQRLSCHEKSLRVLLLVSAKGMATSHCLHAMCCC